MAKITKTNTKELQALNAKLKVLQAELVVANKVAGVDNYLVVKRKESTSRFERVRKTDEPDKAVGHYYLELAISAVAETVFIPLSIASGKKQTGFIYQIEGTGESSIVTAGVKARGDGITQVTLGTIVYVKIPPQKTAEFTILVEIRGKVGKMYKFIIHQINYKLAVTDARYNQYLKQIPSDTLKFS